MTRRTRVVRAALTSIITRSASLLLLVAGCRFGGGDGVADPFTQASTQLDAASDDDATGDRGGSSGGASAGSSGANAGSGGASGDGGANGDGTQADAQVSPASDGGLVDTSDAGTSGPCRAPSVAVCDPVARTGCGAGMQCDVDLLALTLAGRCAFSSPMDGGTCFASPFTESCAAGETCDATGQCRTVCFCDTDCPQGECCHENLGTLGFKLCAACP